MVIMSEEYEERTATNPNALAIEQINWPTFASALQNACGIAFATFPTIIGQIVNEITNGKYRNSTYDD